MPELELIGALSKELGPVGMTVAILAFVFFKAYKPGQKVAMTPPAISKEYEKGSVEAMARISASLSDISNKLDPLSDIAKSVDHLERSIDSFVRLK